MFCNPDAGHLKSRPWVTHPKGYFQPAVLAVHRTGRVLYRWRCVPKYANLSGAGARPDAQYVWRSIQGNLSGTEDAPVDQKPEMAYEDFSWPKFLLYGSAHGWFLAPKMFPLARKGDENYKALSNVSQRFKTMTLRIYAFVALWLLLLFTLPIVWVAVIFLVWLAIYIPGVVALHRQFQNEPEPY